MAKQVEGRTKEVDMSFFLFVDESGHDRQLAPAEVLGGFVIRDGTLWSFVQAVFGLQKAIFGITYPELNRERREKLRMGVGTQFPEGEEHKEIKGDNCLNTRVFKRAAQYPAIADEERRSLAEFCLRNGAQAGKKELSALAQAKLVYVSKLFDLCHTYGGRCFGIVVPKDAPGERKIAALRKDYAYLFERFFHFVNEKEKMHVGIIVFDELDKSASHILLGQMEAYYRDLQTGRDRAERIVPEPFFVHSDLTIGIQVADLVAYLLSWGHSFNRGAMVPRNRAELSPYVDQVMRLSNVSPGAEQKIDGVSVVYDLRTRIEKTKGNAANAAKPSN